MGALLLVPLLLIGAVYVAQLAVALRAAAGHRRRRAILDGAAVALGVPPGERRTDIMGFARGVPVTFSLRGFVASVEIDLPAAELLVAIRPRLVAARRPVDDPFEAEMTVEGAPLDVVRCLLGAELRAEILRLRPLEVLLDGTTLEITAEPTGAGEVARMIELALRLAAAVPAAVEEADRRVTELAGSPYRPEPDSAALRLAHDTRAVEVEALHATWAERAHAVRRALLLAAILVGLLVISLAAGG
jgi:hypothetical protein